MRNMTYVYIPMHQPYDCDMMYGRGVFIMLSLDFCKTSILWSSRVYCPRAKSRDPQNIPEINLYWHRLFPLISYSHYIVLYKTYINHPKSHPFSDQIFNGQLSTLPPPSTTNPCIHVPIPISTVFRTRQKNSNIRHLSFRI
jgi:hypothetical protein